MSEAGFIPLVDTMAGAADSFQPWIGPGFIPERAPAARIDEYARGLAEGQQLAETAFAQERECLQQLVAAAQALQPAEPGTIRDLIAITVDRLVREIIGASPVDPDMLRSQIDAAIAFAGPIDPGATLRLCPADLALLEGVPLPIAALADPALPPGTLCLDTARGMIEHGRGPALDAIGLQLGLSADGA